MRELRKIEKAVISFEKMLIEDPQKARTYKNEYKDYVETLLEVMKNYIDTTADIFETYCDSCVKVWDAPTCNLSKKIRRTIDMAIINYYLNILSLELSKAGMLQRRLIKINDRFTQLQYFCKD